MIFFKFLLISFQMKNNDDMLLVQCTKMKELIRLDAHVAMRDMDFEIQISKQV